MRGMTVLAAGLAAGALVAGAFLAGRATAGRGGTDHDAAYSSGYAAGLRAGEAQGVREGRALQEAGSLPAAEARAARVAFDDGYRAGADDAFGGWDGGWALGTPYVVTLEPGTGGVTYRIATRVTLEPGVGYRLCAGGHDLCPQH